MFTHYRSFYRLRYPETGRPTFIRDGGQRTFPVIDCSEEGFRYHPGTRSEPDPEMGQAIDGTLQFRGGATVKVSGTVVRIQDGEVAIHLSKQRIPFGIMLHEQLFLRRRYPFFFQGEDNPVQRPQAVRKA